MKISELSQIDLQNISNIETINSAENLLYELSLNESEPIRNIANRKLAQLANNPTYQQIILERLNNNDVKDVKQNIKEEKIEHQSFQRNTNAGIKIEERKKEVSKNEEIEKAFTKLTLQQQQAIIHLEYLYLPELRQQIREFMLDDSKATAENWANIINTQLKGDLVRVETDKDGNKFTTMADNTPTDKAKETSLLSQEGFKTSVELDKMPQAVEQAIVVDAAGTQVASNKMEESEETREKLAGFFSTKENLDAQAAAYNLYHDVFITHADNLKKLEGLNNEEKEDLLAKYEKNLAKNIEKFFNTHKVDLSTEDNQRRFISYVMSNALDEIKGGQLSPEQVKQILVKNCKLDQALVNSVVNEEVETKKFQQSEEFLRMADEVDTPDKKYKYEYEDLYPKVIKTAEEEKENELTQQNKETAKIAIVNIDKK